MKLTRTNLGIFSDCFQGRYKVGQWDSPCGE